MNLHMHKRIEASCFLLRTKKGDFERHLSNVPMRIFLILRSEQPCSHSGRTKNETLQKPCPHYPLLVLHLDVAEEKTHGGTAGTQEAFHQDSEQLLHNSTINFKQGKPRCNKPNMKKGNFSKATSPIKSHWDCTKECEDHVQEVFASLEAFVGAFPHAVSAVGALGLRKAVFERDLKWKQVNIRNQQLVRTWKDALH